MQEVMLRKPVERHGTVSETPDLLEVLSATEPSDVGFLSGYLDLESGESASMSFFDRRHGELRSDLPGAAGRDLDQAARLARAALQDIWSADGPCPRAVAIFARGMAGGQALSVIPLEYRVEPMLTFYRVPDLVPLLAGQQPAEAYTLVLARQGGVQVLDVHGRQSVSRAWAAYRCESEGGIGGAPVNGLQRRFRSLCRGLAGPDVGRPIVVAGDASCLDALTAALPARAVSRLRDVMRVPSHLDAQAALAFVRQRVARRLDLRGERVVARLQRRMEANDLAVTGAQGCYDALGAAVAETLVIDADHAFPAMSRCLACGQVQAHGAGSGCGHCESPRPHEWRPVIELVRLAVQQGVPVVFSDSEHLQALGGVGCLLREPVANGLIAAPRARNARLELVA
jgi:hypothetical protein